MTILFCLWLAAAAGAQDDAEGPLGEARELALSGRFAEAIPIYEQLIADLEQQEGKDAWNLVYLTYELAVQHHSLGAIDEAESAYRRSMTIAESHRGAKDPALVPSLRGLATLAANDGRLDTAETLYRRALEIQEADDRDQAGMVRTLAELGLLCQLQDRTAEAEKLYRRALETAESDLEDSDVAVIVSNLGALYDGQGRYEEAEPLFGRALEIRERLLGRDHPDLARLHEKLGSFQYRGRRFAEAAASYERSLKIREQAGQEDLAVAKVLAHLAASYRQLGRSTAAEAHFGMARAILDAQCGGREYTEACLGAITRHRDLLKERLVPPAETAPRVTVAEPVTPAPEVIADSAATPPPTAVAPANPPVEPPSEAAPDRAQASAKEPAEAPATSLQPGIVSAIGTRSGRFHRLQVGAREDAEEATLILDQLRQSHPELLGDLPARIVRVDLGERGVWHRIQIGEFDRVAGAKKLCDEIVRRGHEGCWVITTED